jgi:hypothetical protein
MDYDDISASIEEIFNPEPDEDGHRREWPHDRLRTHHKFNFKYMEDWLWEGAT